MKGVRMPTRPKHLLITLAVLAALVTFFIFLVMYLYDLESEAGTLREKCHNLVMNFPKNVPFPPVRDEVVFHAYWREIFDTRPFGIKQAAVLKAFLATQNLNHTRFVLWVTKDISNNRYLKPLLASKHISMRFYDVMEQIKGTPLESIRDTIEAAEDEKAYLDGDLFRLVILYKYGGLYLDMDTLLVNDLAPLIDREFMFEWDCDYRRTDHSMNGAVMRMYKASNAISELLSEVLVTPPKKNTFAWGGLLYQTVYNRLKEENVHPWTVWPWCFFDIRQCYYDDDAEMFLEVPFNRKLVTSVFAIHWHNRWDQPIHPNSMFAFLEIRMNKILMERFGTTFDPPADDL